MKTIIDLGQHQSCSSDYWWRDYRTPAEKRQQIAESMWTRPMVEPRSLDLPHLLKDFVPPANPNEFTTVLQLSLEFS